MDDFDRFLDLQLRRMLDPVVATPAPRRRGARPRAWQPILVIGDPIEQAPEATPNVEPVVATVPVARTQL